MNKTIVFIVAGLLVSFVAASCSGGGGNPTSPPNKTESGQGLTSQAEQSPQSGANLWGFYDISIDVEGKRVEVTPNRSFEFTVNVVKFLNNDPLGLKVKFNGTTPGTGYVDIDMDVTIKHPLSDHAFDGYDVRGIFIGNGAKPLTFNHALKYPVNGTDQLLLNADGYSRWFNPTEFFVPKMFGYIPGKAATPGYTGSGTLNAYKYFGEGLAKGDDLWPYLTSGGSQVGYFLAGTSNTRNYVIRFPMPNPGARFEYAVLADWTGTKPANHPSHAAEAVGMKLVDNSNLYYVSDSDKGGRLQFDITVFDWHAALTGGTMQDYKIEVEGTVMTGYTDVDMTPTASGDHWFTYHFDSSANNIIGNDGNEVWIMVEKQNVDYSNPLNVPNGTGTSKLTACYRFPLTVSDVAPTGITVVDPNGGNQWKVGDSAEIKWTASPGIQNVVIGLSLNSGADYTQMISASTPNDGSFIWNPIPSEALGDNNRIKIRDAANASVFDESDTDFSVVQPLITVLSPSDGETWEAGSDHEITWTSQYITGLVDIWYSTDNFVSDINQIADKQPNNGTYMWNNIPNIASDTVKVRVSTDSTPLYKDESDNYFEIFTPSGPITVTYPNGGEEWKVGEAPIITWIADPSILNVKIEASSDSGATYPFTIVDSTPNTGSFQQDPLPEDAASDHSRIRISDVTNPSVYDESDEDFTVLDAEIDIIEPNGGETLVVGSSFEITWWCTEPGGTVSIIYSKDNFSSDLHDINTAAPNTGSFMWDNIPDDVSDSVKIGIKWSGLEIYGSSDDVFSIIEPPPSLTVLSPNGGEELRAGDSYEITWTSIEVNDPVNILYSEDNFQSDINTIVAATPNTGSYMWDPIPFDPSDTVRIKVESSVDSGIYDVSDNDLTLADSGWADTYGTSYNDYGYDVVSDSSGNTMVCGTLGTSYTDQNAFLRKYNPDGTVAWTDSWGDGGSAGAVGVEVDSDGNIYTAGGFYGMSVDLDPGPGSVLRSSDSNGDICVSKFDPSGILLGVKTWGGYNANAGEGAKGIAIDSSYVYYAGQFTGTNVDFDPGAGTSLKTSVGGADAFLSIFDHDGNFVWAGTWGGNANQYYGDEAHGVAVDASGNVWVTGIFKGSNIDFDPDASASYKLSSNGDYDAFLSMFNSSHVFQNARAWGGTGYDSADGVAAGLSGVYVTGYFNGTGVDFDPGSSSDLKSSAGGSDAYLSKFDLSGNYGWARTWGGSAADIARGVAFDEDGFLVSVGYFRGSNIDFDPGAGTDLHSSNGLSDVFYTVFDPDDGNYILSRTWGGPDYDSAYGVCASFGRLFITGAFMGNVEFAPTGSPCFEPSDPHNGGDMYNIFLAKYMPDGCW